MIKGQIISLSPSTERRVRETNNFSAQEARTSEQKMKNDITSAQGKCLKASGGATVAILHS